MEQKFKKTPAGEIPVDWGVSTVGECSGINAKSLKEDVPPETKFRYIDISSINQTGKISEMKEIVFKNAPSRARRVIRLGDILVSTVRPYLKAFARINFSSSTNLIASTGFAVLTPTPKVDGGYLYQFILSNPFVQFLEERMTGSNYPAVNPSYVAMCPFPLPPLAEQQKIAEVLQSVDDAILKTDAVIEKTKELKKGLMQTLLTKKWEVKKIKELFKVETGTTPSTKQKEYWNGGTISWITPTDMSQSNGELYIKESERKISEKGFKEANLTMIPVNSIIISTRAPVGYVSVIKNETTFNQGCKGLVPKNNEKMYPEFYAYYLLYNKVKLEHLSGGSTFKELSKAALEQFDIPLPSLSEQKEIAEVLSTVDDEISHEEEHKSQLERIKKALMGVLLTGKVRV